MALIVLPPCPYPGHEKIFRGILDPNIIGILFWCFQKFTSFTSYLNMPPFIKVRCNYQAPSIQSRLAEHFIRQKQFFTPGIQCCSWRSEFSGRIFKTIPEATTTLPAVNGCGHKPPFHLSNFPVAPPGWPDDWPMQVIKPGLIRFWG